MSEELSHHLEQASILMKSELLEISENIRIMFEKPFNIQLEEDNKTFITLKGIDSHRFIFTLGNYEIERQIELLRFNEDFDILYKLYDITKKSLKDRNQKDSLFVKGERKSDR